MIIIPHRQLCPWVPHLYPLSPAVQLAQPRTAPLLFFPGVFLASEAVGQVRSDMELTPPWEHKTGDWWVLVYKYPSSPTSQAGSCTHHRWPSLCCLTSAILYQHVFYSQVLLTPGIFFHGLLLGKPKHEDTSLRRKRKHWRRCGHSL